MKTKAHFFTALFMIILVLFYTVPGLSQTWVPEKISSDGPDEKWLRYISNEATNLMLHDSTCKRAEEYANRENNIQGYKTCISVYDKGSDNKIDWNSWRVYFGELKPDHFEFDSLVKFDDSRRPISQIKEIGKDTSKVYQMAKAAEIAITSRDLPKGLELEVIVNNYRLDEYSVYILPKWEEGEAYHLGGEFHFIIDTKNQKILRWKMLNNKVAVFHPQLLKNTKISRSENSLSPYPTATEILMMYRRKTGPAHISIAQEWHYGILPNSKIGVLGLKENLNEDQWFREWEESKGF